jgi:O-antigen/teichoic acid export membrane protein
MVGISDLLVVRILDLVAQAFQAVEVLQKNAEVYVALGIARTGTAILFISGMQSPTATSWAAMYLIAAIIAASYALIAMLKSPLGLPRVRFLLSFSEFRQGLYYAIGLASHTAYNDIDKAMLLRLASLEATGIYAAAYRIVDVAFQPVASLTAAAYPRFFRHGKGGIRECLCFAKRLLWYAGIYGLIAAALLYLFAPILPVFLGHQFAATSTVLIWLSPLVFLRTVHYFFSNALTGAGLQGIRTAIQVVVAVINVALNLWLIPLYSWRGAAWSSVITDGLLVLSTWIAAELLSANSGQTSAQSTMLGVDGPT